MKKNAKLNTEQLMTRVGRQYSALNNGIVGSIGVVRNVMPAVQVPAGQKKPKPYVAYVVTVSPAGLQNPAMQQSQYLSVTTNATGLDDALRKLSVTLETYVKRELLQAKTKLEALEKAAAEIES
jgi:hypothetical protein